MSTFKSLLSRACTRVQTNKVCISQKDVNWMNLSWSKLLKYNINNPRKGILKILGNIPISRFMSQTSLINLYFSDNHEDSLEDSQASKGDHQFRAKRFKENQDYWDFYNLWESDSMSVCWLSPLIINT